MRIRRPARMTEELFIPFNFFNLAIETPVLRAIAPKVSPWRTLVQAFVLERTLSPTEPYSFFKERERISNDLAVIMI